MFFLFYYIFLFHNMYCLWKNIILMPSLSMGREHKHNVYWTSFDPLLATLILFSPWLRLRLFPKISFLMLIFGQMWHKPQDGSWILGDCLPVPHSNKAALASWWLELFSAWVLGHGFIALSLSPGDRCPVPYRFFLEGLLYLCWSSTKLDIFSPWVWNMTSPLPFLNS